MSSIYLLYKVTIVCYTGYTQTSDTYLWSLDKISYIQVSWNIMTQAYVRILQTNFVKLSFSNKYCSYSVLKLLTYIFIHDSYIWLSVNSPNHVIQYSFIYLYLDFTYKLAGVNV